MHKCNLHYAATLMMTSQILKSQGFKKTQNSRYLENEKLFFLQIKKFINYASSAALWQRISEVTFKSFGCTKICNNSKWTKMSWNQVTQPTNSNSNWRPIFPMPLLTKEAFFTWAFQTWVSLFQYSQEFKIVCQ